MVMPNNRARRSDRGLRTNVNTSSEYALSCCVAERRVQEGVGINPGSKILSTKSGLTPRRMPLHFLGDASIVTTWFSRTTAVNRFQRRVAKERAIAERASRERTKTPSRISPLVVARKLVAELQEQAEVHASRRCNANANLEVGAV